MKAFGGRKAGPPRTILNSKRESHCPTQHKRRLEWATGPYVNKGSIRWPWTLQKRSALSNHATEGGRDEDRQGFTRFRIAMGLCTAPRCFYSSCSRLCKSSRLVYGNQDRLLHLGCSPRALQA